MTMLVAEKSTLDESQEMAILLVGDWLSRRRRDPKVPQVFRLGGHAGSGKTTVIKEIVRERADLDIVVMTLAGKAAAVLREKGIPDATNLHQVIYAPDPDVMTERERLLAEMKGTTDSDDVGEPRSGRPDPASD